MKECSNAKSIAQSYESGCRQPGIFAELAGLPRRQQRIRSLAPTLSQVNDWSIPFQPAAIGTEERPCVPARNPQPGSHQQSPLSGTCDFGTLESQRDPRQPIDQLSPGVVPCRDANVLSLRKLLL